MFKVHGFLDDKMVIRQRMEHLPRCGDTVRLSGERYAKVAEVIWCMDEQNDTPSFEGQRINLRMETLTDPPPNGEVRGASRLAGEASSREAATSTVVLGG